MHHFFINEDQIYGSSAYITGSDVNHIVNVLRMRAGEELLISVDGEWDYLCRIESIEPSRVNLYVLESTNTRELPVKIVLLQGLPKSDKLELIIQKSVELGVSEIVPVITKRVVVKLEDKKKRARAERWNAIAKSAAKQSKRSIIPKVSEPLSFKSALEFAKDFDMKLLPYENAEGIKKTGELLETLTGKRNIVIFIGPEGGFEEREVYEAENFGFEAITLGKRILRCETAGLVLLSNIMIRLEE